MIENQKERYHSNKFLGVIKGRRIKSYSRSSLTGSNNALHQLHVVSKRAALVSKQKYWDNPDASVDAAQSAVDIFECTYENARTLVLKGYFSLKNVYQATKTASEKLEHHLLVPVRDIILLPTFNGIERAVDSTVSFVRSEEANTLANQSLTILSRTPVIGESILAPAVAKTVNIMRCTWEVIQYPIPSRQLVRQSVESSLTFLKLAVSSSSREIFFYIQLVDASITRALSHTQWRILGSGPYINLSKENKIDILNHLSDRYLSLASDVARYELVCHIRYQNKILYQDLICSGLLYNRGGDLIKDDIWIKNESSFANDSDVLLMDGTGTEVKDLHDVNPIWWYISSSHNDKHGKDAPWICFDERDQIILEQAFVKEKVLSQVFFSKDPNITADLNSGNRNCAICDEDRDYFKCCKPSEADVLVDQNRHVVSFDLCESFTEIRNGAPSSFAENHLWIDKLTLPLHISMRPTFWRFQASNAVRRGVWLMDTKRHGLQPYCDESSAILENAYHFLAWKESQAGHDIENIVLTVQVLSPDGQETQLVQFRSLKHITAIPKTVAGGVALFKRRVYRGATIRLSSDSCNTSSNCQVGNRMQVAASRTNFLDSCRRSPMWNEPNEASGEKAGHLVLVVHGIGEMLKSTDAFGLPLPGLTSTIIECCDSLRKNHYEVLHHLHSSCNHNTNIFNGDRVEYLPVEWHEDVSSQLRKTRHDIDNLQSDSVTLSDITLPTIPHLRNFANDTMLDILYFMSPKHHDIMVRVVSEEMTRVVETYKKITGFCGKISILSHSLGSVITWDILSHMDTHMDCTLDDIRPEASSDDKIYPQLSFKVEQMFMIGSPLAVFLMMRNNDKPLSQQFYLRACPRVYNIFHPYDPVAYRLEPILHRDNSSVEPKIIPHWKGGFRVQYQTKLLLRKILDETKKNQKWMIKAVESRVEQLVDGAPDEFHDDLSFQSDDSDYQEVHVGQLNAGKRIDYLLQEKEIENANEYISALAAHSNYWQEKDLSNFIATRILNYHDYDDDEMMQMNT